MYEMSLASVDDSQPPTYDVWTKVDIDTSTSQMKVDPTEYDDFNSSSSFYDGHLSEAAAYAILGSGALVVLLLSFLGFRKCRRCRRSEDYELHDEESTKRISKIWEQDMMRWLSFYSDVSSQPSQYQGHETFKQEVLDLRHLNYLSPDSKIEAVVERSAGVATAEEIATRPSTTKYKLGEEQDSDAADTQKTWTASHQGRPLAADGMDAADDPQDGSTFVGFRGRHYEHRYEKSTHI